MVQEKGHAQTGNDIHHFSTTVGLSITQEPPFKTILPWYVYCSLPETEYRTFFPIACSFQTFLLIGSRFPPLVCIKIWRDPQWIQQLQCKLNEPIYVDDSRVSLRVNDNGGYPSVGTDVVAIGFGTTSSGGPQPEFLRDVTVKVNSNSACAAAPDSVYSSQSIRAGIICACKYCITQLKPK